MDTKHKLWFISAKRTSNFHLILSKCSIQRPQHVRRLTMMVHRIQAAFVGIYMYSKMPESRQFRNSQIIIH